MDRRPTHSDVDEPEDPDDPLIGEVLADRYEIVERVGEGGMGTVYLGRHVTLGKPVALKVLRSDFLDRRDLAERFLREAQAASRIGHENIVDIMDFGQTPEGAPYFVMEHLDGLELDELLDREGRLPWPRARGIVLQIARALSAAHRCGVIHRDLKPGNVLLVNRDANPDYVKLLDFGIAKLEDEAALTHDGCVFGTVAYMAPEQALGTTVDARADIYALGCVAFELLTGQLPFEARNPQAMLDMHIEDPPPKPRELAPYADIPEAVEDAILRALAKDPDERFEDMADFVRALAAVPAETTGMGVLGEEIGLRERVEPRRAASAIHKRTPSSPMPVAGLRVPVPVELPLLTVLYLVLVDLAEGAVIGDEAELLVARLHEWGPEIPRREIVRLLRHALADLQNLPSITARVARARTSAQQLQALLPRTQLASILADLYELAGTGGEVVEPALRFLVNVTDWLDLTPDPRLLATAYLYLTLGYADGVLDLDEQRVLAEQLQAWAPDSAGAEVQTVLRWASAEFERRKTREEQLACAFDAADQLRLSADEDALRRILADLWRIAGADGHIAEEEQRFIMDMVERFGTAR
ncbi:protein kinase [Pseudenhygromyxa sp. WMMC2535]|uniref:protein kinase domain-containing protein n=1 Tax=Pseudenhygromyxa sp. WMMC2535 TaxID=2712867 RepID=UPI00155664A1|nr:protein kinase [Pseudenhygromyxa sp. WMMC2535]NVB38895.1 protein kinase [Pseudenhygromyxa sp. WMMC2535]